MIRGITHAGLSATGQVPQATDGLAGQFATGFFSWRKRKRLMRNPDELVQLIDRYRLGESRRLMLGIAFASDFTAVTASLLLAQGRGKSLRPLWMEFRQTELTPSISGACHRFSTGEATGIGELVQFRNDVATQLAIAARKAMAISDSSEKKLLAICIDDPGIWLRDYDGAIAWEPLVSATTLCEQTGVCVIDGLPLRDLAGGGRGWPLEPLAWWLMFADRGRKTANTSRVLVQWADVCRICWLPPSDGIDNELPDIREQTFPGAAFESALLQALGCGPITAAERDRLGAAGSTHRELLAILTKTIDERRSCWHPSETACQAWPLENALSGIREYGISIGDVLKTLAHGLALQLKGFLEQQKTSPLRLEFVAAGQLDQHGLLGSEIGNLNEVCWFADRPFNYRPAGLSSATAAMMGLIHIDQMPLGIPGLTGASNARVAGRLTPGNLAGFRRLIMEMGDTSPPAMRLRDAV
jgi:hypothetical protein